MGENPLNITFEEFKKTDWYKERPALIKEVIEKYPPTQYYDLRGQKCCISSYEEPISNKIEDVTCTVHKTESFIGIDFDIFDVPLTSLKPL